MDFIEAVRHSALSRQAEIDTLASYWRAVDEVIEPKGIEEHLSFRYRPCTEKRIKPRRDKAWEGRANPKGIPCLYTASDAITAVSELRPALGFPLTLAQLVPNRQLRLVDCTLDELPSPEVSLGPGNVEQIERSVWGLINRAFSAPVRRSDDTADYAPTQLLAEVFKDIGFDGVMYRSAFGENGVNAAFFNPDDLDVVRSWVYEVVDIKHKASVVPDGPGFHFDNG